MDLLIGERIKKYRKENHYFVRTKNVVSGILGR